MPKPNPLTQGLERQPARDTRSAEPVARARRSKVPTERTGNTQPSRAGRVLVAGHFAPEVQIALKVLAAEERTTLQALLAEGINTVFAKRGKPEIAGITAE